MERIVYLLGAGFSAPLGLPVMSNFFFKSQNMYFEDPERYDYFKGVFKTIQKISVGKNYFETNVFNIEDVLSILEMSDYLKGRRLRKRFSRYIIDVIEYYTPKIEHHVNYASQTPGTTWDNLFLGPDVRWFGYIAFSCALLNLNFHGRFNGLIHALIENRQGVYFTPDANPDVAYSIVTLNYDRVLEQVPDRINAMFNNPFGSQVRYARPGEEQLVSHNGGDHRLTPIAKLHGSTDMGEIVPPTWSKGVVRSVSPAWEMAHKAISEATQIRILGYSLPTADAYVKYLLKSGVIEGGQRLHKIDVICRDGDGSVRKRFDDFIKFDYYNFVAGDIAEYLGLHEKEYEIKDYHARLSERSKGWRFDKLEDSHRKFMSGSRPQ